MKRMNPNKKRYFLLVGVILVTLSLWVTAYSVSHERSLTFVEKGIKDTVLTIGNIVGMPIRYLKNQWEILQNSEEIYRKYEQLEKEYTSLEQYEASLKELELENQKLQDLLDLDTSLSQYEKVHATVISRNINYWLDSFTIDKGSSSGISSNMAVLSSGGLIGYVSQVSNDTSTVKLFTNSSFDNKISVKIEISENNYAYGLLTGYDQDKQVYQIEGISEYVDIPIGTMVTTTGFGDKFPSGLLIGTVQDIETDSFDLAKIVAVKPAQDLDDISFTTVLIREVDKS